MLPPPCAQTDYLGGRNNAPAAFVWAPADSRITEIRSCGHLQAVRFLAKDLLMGKTMWTNSRANQGLGEANAHRWPPPWRSRPRPRGILPTSGSPLPPPRNSADAARHR